MPVWQVVEKASRMQLPGPRLATLLPVSVQEVAYFIIRHGLVVLTTLAG